VRACRGRFGRTRPRPRDEFVAVAVAVEPADPGEGDVVRLDQAVADGRLDLLAAGGADERLVDPTDDVVYLDLPAESLVLGFEFRVALAQVGLAGQAVEGGLRRRHERLGQPPGVVVDAGAVGRHDEHAVVPIRDEQAAVDGLAEHPRLAGGLGVVEDDPLAGGEAVPDRGVVTDANGRRPPPERASNASV